MDFDLTMLLTVKAKTYKLNSHGIQFFWPNLKSFEVQIRNFRPTVSLIRIKKPNSNSNSKVDLNGRITNYIELNSKFIRT